MFIVVLLFLCTPLYIECKVKSDDYYSILNVKPTASEVDIKKAYRKLAMKYHPDKNNASNAQNIFENVSKAYEILSDKDKRKLYDQYGAAYFEPGGAASSQQEQHSKPFTQQQYTSPYTTYTYTSSSSGDNSYPHAQQQQQFRHQFTDPFKLFESMFSGSNGHNSMFNMFANKESNLNGNFNQKTRKDRMYNMFDTQQQKQQKQQQSASSTKRSKQQHDKPQRQQQNTITVKKYDINTLTKELYNSKPFDNIPLSIILLPSTTKQVTNAQNIANTLKSNTLTTSSVKPTYFIVNDNSVQKTIKNIFDIQDTQQATMIIYRSKHNKFTTQTIKTVDDAKHIIEQIEDGNINFSKLKHTFIDIK